MVDRMSVFSLHSRNDRGLTISSVHVWTWQFTKLMHTIMNEAFAAKSPTYTKIMEMDKRVRDFPDPPCLHDPPTTGAPGEDVTRIMQTMSVSLYKETTHLNLHRPYLSQALKDMPEDPLRHKYGASVMVIYRSAWRIINSVEQAYKAAPGIMSRMSLQWSQSLACAVSAEQEQTASRGLTKLHSRLFSVC